MGGCRRADRGYQGCAAGDRLAVRWLAREAAGGGGVAGVRIPASGTIEWENIAIRSPFKTDTWISSIEILPGDPARVHHMCFEFKAHQPNVVYNQYEWAEVPRDAEGAAVQRGRGSSPPEAGCAPDDRVDAQCRLD